MTCIDGYIFDDHQLRKVFHCIQGSGSSVIVTWNGTLSPCQGSYSNIFNFLQEILVSLGGCYFFLPIFKSLKRIKKKRKSPPQKFRLIHLVYFTIHSSQLIIIIIIIITRNLYCASKCRSKLRGAGHCTSAGRMTRILRHVADTFPPARQRTILNNHWIINILINTSMVLICVLVTYLMMTAEVGLPDVV